MPKQPNHYLAFVLVTGSILFGANRENLGAEPVLSRHYVQSATDVTAEIQSLSVVSIAELQALAAENNPTLRLLKSKIGAAHGQWIQAGLKPNPTIGYDGEEIGSDGKAGKQGVVVEQEIITGGKRKLDRSIASWEKDASRKRWELQFQSIQNDIRARAYEALAAYRIVQIDEKLAEISRKSIQAAEELGKAGEVSKIDLLQIRAKANESQARLAAAKNAERLAWKRIAAMVGIQEWAPQRISDSLEEVQPVFDRETAWRVICECSPQMAVARSRVGQARMTLARENAGRIPDVTIGGGVHYDYGERQTLGNLNVSVPLRIFDKNQGNIYRAHAELAAACRELDRLTLVLYEDFVGFYSTLETAREQVRLYKEKILPDVLESLELSLRGYRQGEYGYMDLLTAQQLYWESHTQYVTALKDYAISCVYLDGYLAKGGLESE